MPVIIEECSGCGLSGWGWADNAYGGVGTLVYFKTAGRQQIRIQAREDGVSIDQIVPSAALDLTGAPGAARNDTTILAQTAATPPTAGYAVLYAPEAPINDTTILPK